MENSLTNDRVMNLAFQSLMRQFREQFNSNINRNMSNQESRSNEAMFASQPPPSSASSSSFSSSQKRPFMPKNVLLPPLATNDSQNQQIKRIIEALNKIVERQIALGDMVRDLKTTMDSLAGTIHSLVKKVDALTRAGGGSATQVNGNSSNGAFSFPRPMQFNISDSNAVKEEPSAIKEKAADFAAVSRKRSFAEMTPEEQLVVQQNSHLNKNSVHVCEVCGKELGDFWKYSRHKIAHSGEKPFKCNFDGCGKRYPYYTSLQRHKFVHTGLQPYKCPAERCAEKFRDKPALDAHFRASHSKNQRN